MHRRSGTALLAIVTVALAACGNSPASPDASNADLVSPSPPGASVEAEPSSTLRPVPTPDPSSAIITCTKRLKIGLVTESGTLDDHGYNQSAHDGVQHAMAQAPSCFAFDSVESEAPADYAKNVSRFTEDGYDAVIGVGSEAGVTFGQTAVLADALGDASKLHSDVRFIAVDASPDIGHDEAWDSNGESLFFAEDEAGYLAGVLAASMSKADHIGVVGGLLVVPPVERFVEGYVNGARSVNPDIDVDIVYATSFIDPPQGRSAAEKMIDNGADVIFGAGGLTGNGALEAACKHKGVYAIGVDTDQSLTLPDASTCMLSSAVKHIDRAVSAALLRIAKDKFTPGFHTDDASTGGIGLAPFHDHDADVPATVRDRLAQTVAGLADGTIKTRVTVDGRTPNP